VKDPTMESIGIIGLVAATLTTSAFVPQVYRAWKSKSIKDISLLMYLAFLDDEGLLSLP